MSLAISVEINAGDVVESLQSASAAMADSDGMHGSIATAAMKLVRDHLTGKYLSRDGPRGDFWADVIHSTESTADGSSATVSLNELGITLRYNGGDVLPGKSISSFTGKITKALAVPSDKVPVAGGRQIRPGRAGLLAFVRAASAGETVGYLVEGMPKFATRGKNKGKPYIVPKPGGSLLYTLRTITRHKADPNILPPEQEIEDTAVAAIIAFIESKV
jgi:hypothetical protein